MLLFTYYIIEFSKKTVGSKIVKNILFSLGKEKFFYVEKIFSPNLRKTINRLVIFLPGKGCWWAKQKGGGCTMCGFGEKLKKIKSYRYTDWDIVSLFKIALELTEEKYSEIAIFNGGSFLNDNEISSSVQEDIARLVSKSPTTQTLYIESRPEFILKNKIEKIVKILGEKKLKVGIGLESITSTIRNKNINKGITLRQYEKAVQILIKEKAEILTYVLLKPIYISEKEAIKETIKTIKYALKKRSNEIALETAFVQEGTVMAELFQKGMYQPAWLWSIIKVIKKTYNLGFVHIGAFNDEPAPVAIPSNCPLCNEKVINAIKHYRENHSLKNFEGLNCRCKSKWKREVL
jgi:radical SAM enzyme (TIGR01210 family)